MTDFPSHYFTHKDPDRRRPLGDDNMAKPRGRTGVIKKMAQFIKAQYHLDKLEERTTAHNIQMKIHTTRQHMLQHNSLPLPTPAGDHVRSNLTANWEEGHRHLLHNHLRFRIQTLDREIAEQDLRHWQHCLHIAKGWFSRTFLGFTHNNSITG